MQYVMSATRCDRVIVARFRLACAIVTGHHDELEQPSARWWKQMRERDAPGMCDDMISESRTDQTGTNAADQTWSHIRIVMLTPNLTSEIQPCDQGIIRSTGNNS